MAVKERYSSEIMRGEVDSGSSHDSCGDTGALNEGVLDSTVHRNGPSGGIMGS